MDRNLSTFNPTKWVENYADALYAYTLARVNDVQQAEDIVQNTFLSAWKARERTDRLLKKTGYMPFSKIKLLTIFVNRLPAALRCQQEKKNCILMKAATGRGNHPKRMGRTP